MGDKSAFSTSIGKKLVMSVTGLIMCLFLVGHLSGNMLLYVSAEAFNAYADFLAANKALLLFVEFFLLVVLVAHIVVAVRLTKENAVAKPVKYAVEASGGRRTWASSHMLHSGMVTLIFLIVHIWTFKFGPWSNEPNSAQTLYDLVALRFSNLTYSAGYLIAMVLIGNHLYHAITSACITLGIANSSLLCKIRRISLVFSVLISVGFASFPIVFYIKSFSGNG